METPRNSGRSPYGERGLKLEVVDSEKVDDGRSPYGERGLKFQILDLDDITGLVALLTESVD